MLMIFRFKYSSCFFSSKMIILQTCFEKPHKLFEKFGQNVNRKEEWNKIAEKLADDGIYVKDIPTLRKHITNWTRRALVNRYY